LVFLKKKPEINYILSHCFIKNTAYNFSFGSLAEVALLPCSFLRPLFAHLKKSALRVFTTRQKVAIWIFNSHRLPKYSGNL
jgi:hypothetical protein